MKSCKVLHLFFFVFIFYMYELLKGVSLSVPTPAKSGKYRPVFFGMLGLPAGMSENAVTWITVDNPGKTVTRSKITSTKY